MCLVVVGGGGVWEEGVGVVAGFSFSEPVVCEWSQASQISVSHSYFSGRSWCVAHLVWRECLLFIDPVACIRSSVSCLHRGGEEGVAQQQTDLLSLFTVSSYPFRPFRFSLIYLFTILSLNNISNATCKEWSICFSFWLFDYFLLFSSKYKMPFYLQWTVHVTPERHTRQQNKCEKVFCLITFLRYNIFTFEKSPVEIIFEMFFKILVFPVTVDFVQLQGSWKRG